MRRQSFPRAAHGISRRLAVEALEDRCVLSTVLPALGAVAPLTAPLAGATSAIAAKAAPVSIEVAAVVTATPVASLTAPVASLTAPVAGAIKPLSAGLTNLAQAVTAPVTNVVQTVTAPVTNAVAPLLAPVVSALAPVVDPVIAAVAPVVSVVDALAPPLLNTVGEVGQVATAGLGLSSVVQVQPDGGGLRVTLLGGTGTAGVGLQMNVGTGAAPGGTTGPVGPSPLSLPGPVGVGVTGPGVVVGVGCSQTTTGGGVPVVPPAPTHTAGPTPTGMYKPAEERVPLVPAVAAELPEIGAAHAAPNLGLALEGPRSSDGIPEPTGTGDAVPVAVDDGAIAASAVTAEETAVFWQQFGESFVGGWVGSPIVPDVSTGLAAWGTVATQSLEHLADLGSRFGVGYLAWALALSSAALACEVARRRSAFARIAADEVSFV